MAIKRPFNYKRVFNPSNRFGYTGPTYNPNLNFGYTGGNRGNPNQYGNSMDFSSNMIDGFTREGGRKLLREGIKKGLGGLFGKGAGVTATKLGGVASSSAATGGSAMAGSSQLGGLPSIADWQAAQTAGTGAGIPVNAIAKSVGAVGGGVLAYEGIRKGNEEKGGLGGALAGFSLGGPIGAVIGGIGGALGASFNKEESDLSDKFEGRLIPIAKGDYNKENMKELNGLFEVQAESVEGVDPNLTQNIRSFREAVNTLGTDSQDEEYIRNSGEQLMTNYLNHIEQGNFKFDENANQYANAILSVMESVDKEAAKPFRNRLNQLKG